MDNYNILGDDDVKKYIIKLMIYTNI